jgi:hypothetical protein
MTQHAGPPKIDSTHPALTDISRLKPDREKGQCNLASVMPGESCLRCSGLLVRSYTAALESDLTGKPTEVRRCVNCGDCVDSHILANRWKGPGPLRPRARPRTGSQHTGRPRGRPRGVGTGTTQQMVLE